MTSPAPSKPPSVFALALAKTRSSERFSEMASRLQPNVFRDMAVDWLRGQRVELVGSASLLDYAISTTADLIEETVDRYLDKMNEASLGRPGRPRVPLEETVLLAAAFDRFKRYGRKYALGKAAKLMGGPAVVSASRIEKADAAFLRMVAHTCRIPSTWSRDELLQEAALYLLNANGVIDECVREHANIVRSARHH